ncbi:hypothetical protein EXIGLDRAFT_769183 [Exidia glandulosa HHB12029]|uniref:Uncharacterized protein n=1 Tax=Exidia glandulosa HHB12029 TaxID=1314781 RepID=A0A165HMW2_EXIGL|nr:hypothetical protein EXIGLDRAFT_769183 [Exidia glandulosa HHB12029]
MATRKSQCVKPLSNVEYGGLIGVIVACIASLTAVLIALVVVACRTLRNRYRTGRGGQTLRKIFATHLDVYALCLLLECAVEAVGGILSIRWLGVDVAVQCSRICVIQGALKSFGMSGVQMYTLAIAAHTFLVIVAQWKPPKGFRLPVSVVFSALLYRATFFAIVALASKQRDAPPGPSIFEPTPLWCTISDEYRWFRVTMVYVWVGANTVISNVLYLVLFLYIRGNLVIDPNCIWRMRLRRAPPPTVRLDNECSMSCLSLKMLA